MAKNVDLLSYWMPVLRNIKEFKEIAKAEEPEIKLLLEACESALNNLYIDTADEAGIAYYEKLLNLTVLSGATLEERRFNLFANWNNSKRYTMGELNTLLTSLCGKDNYFITMDYANYHLDVLVALTSFASIDEVRNLLIKVVPANIVITVSIMYNSHNVLSAFTHEELSAYTHEQLRSEVFE